MADGGPVLDRDLAEPHHLLVLPGEVSPAELEALALSRTEEAGWVAERHLRLAPGVHLTGPWPIEAALRAAFDLPRWAEQAYLLRSPVQRAGPLPAELAGVDPVLDAFPAGVPAGVEAEALGHLRALARRLRGALRLAGTGAVVVPDPAAAVDLTVHAPVFLDHDACLQVLRPALPGLRSLVEDVPVGTELEGYALVAPVGPGDQVEVTAVGLEHLPVVLRGVEWAEGGVVAYEIRWRPHDPEAALRPTLGVRRARAGAAQRIEAAAVALQAAVGGVVTDDDGFLVDPADLTG